MSEERESYSDNDSRKLRNNELEPTPLLSTNGSTEGSSSFRGESTVVEELMHEKLAKARAKRAAEELLQEKYVKARANNNGAASSSAPVEGLLQEKLVKSRANVEERPESFQDEPLKPKKRSKHSKHRRKKRHSHHHRHSKGTRSGYHVAPGALEDDDQLSDDEENNARLQDMIATTKTRRQSRHSRRVSLDEHGPEEMEPLEPEEAHPDHSLRESATSQPGAYSVQSSTLFAADDDDFSESDDYDERSWEDLVPMPPAAEQADFDVLINAVAVDDDQPTSTMDLPFAEATSVPRKRPWWCGRSFVIGALSLIVGIVVAVTFSLLASKSSSTSSGDESSEDSGLARITVVIQLDDNPEETSWILQCDDVFVASVPLGSYEGRFQELIETPALVLIGVPCVFSLFDSGGNGIDQGFYELYLGEETTSPDALLVEGSGNFGDIAEVMFEVDAPEPMTDVPVTVVLQFDSMPADIGWSVRCGDVVNVTLPPETYTTPFSGVVETVIAPLAVNCVFSIIDTQGDGLCCVHGAGSYEVYIGANTTNEDNLVARGDNFGSQAQAQFVTRPPQETWTPLGQEIEGTRAKANAGYAVVLSGSGTVVAVGASIHHDDGRRGYVQVLEYNSETTLWENLGDAVEGNPGDNTGSSIALSQDGSVLAVGSMFRDSTDGGVENTGQVQVYLYSPSTAWKQIGQAIEGTSARDNLGFSVSLSSDGTIVAVAAASSLFTPRDEFDVEPGYVRVYQLHDASSQWVQLGQDIVMEADQIKSFVWVSLSGNGMTLAVGINDVFSENAAALSGAVTVYQYDTTSMVWTQMGETLRGLTPRDTFGTAVSLSNEGFVMAVSAPGLTSFRTDDAIAGYVQVYEYSASKKWVQIGQTVAGEHENEYFGFSVSISGDGSVLAVGAPQHSTRDVLAGRVRLYRLNTVTKGWVKIGQDIVGENAGDTAGFSVSLSDNGFICAVGASLHDGEDAKDAGQVRMFTTIPTSNINL